MRIGEPVSAPFLLEGDQVHLWSAQLDLGQGWPEQGLALLSAEERERAQRFRFDRHRERYIAGRFVLRSLLSAYVQTPPARLELAAGEEGKPYLLLPEPGRGLFFNQSESQGRSLIALSREREVGVDLEWMDPRLEVRELAKVALTREETESLRGLPDPRRRELFYALWTAKEAFLKGLGTGLRIAPNQVAVDLSKESVSVSIRSGASARDWSLWSFEPWEGFKAALAVRGPRGEISQRRFEDYWKLSQK